MRLSTILAYNMGRSSAIEKVASNRSALWTALVLVLLTGVARNYDQRYFLETPFWLVGPLLFSLISGTFLYLVVARGFAKSERETESPSIWRTFMTLFWMTAPIAWLYAVPVERFLDSIQAAKANLALLAIVSIWRVLLMSRALSVLWKTPFIRCLGWIIIAATIEVIVVFFISAVFLGDLSKRVLAGMSGMQNSPEERIIANTLGSVWRWSWAVLIVTGIALGARPFDGTVQPFPKSQPAKLPIVLWCIFALFWIAIAFPAQREQQRYHNHAQLIDQSKYAEAFQYLTTLQPTDLPPSRRIRPSPFEHEVWTAMPSTISLLTTNTPQWIRTLYLNHLSASYRHYWNGFRSLTNVVPMYAAIETLTESREWLRTNESSLARQGLNSRYQYSESIVASNTVALKQIQEILRRMGMSESNLSDLESH